MTTRSDTLRKAAILIASLDREAADGLLGQMTEVEAQRVRQAVIRLESIDPDEQDEVVEEFLRLRPLVPDKQPPGIELDESLMRRLENRTADYVQSPPVPDEPALGDEMPFRFLHETDVRDVAPLLAGEQPQTIAVVLANLPQAHAAELLAGLPPRVQVEVIRRLAALEQTDPEVLREVERGVQNLLASRSTGPRRPLPSLTAVSSILEAAPPGAQAEMFANLTRHDARLAAKLRPHPPTESDDVPNLPAMDFDDLLKMDGPTLALILGQADPETARLALAGAPPRLIERLVRQLPAADGAALRAALADLGATSLRDVTEAQRQIAQLAARLVYEGRIAPKRGARMSVAD